MDFRQGLQARGWLLILAWAALGTLPVGAQDDPNLGIGPTASSPQLAPMQAEEKSQGAFGPDAQVFIVTASEFSGRLLSATAPLANSSANGYYYSPGSLTPARYYAPLHLPAGAVVGGIQCYVVDSSANDAHFELQSYYYDAGTQSAGGSSIAGWSSSGMGYVQPSSPALNHTIRYEDGNRSYVYYLSADLASDLSLRECRITWKRSVSPAPAAATFGDVPTDYIYFRAIEALAAAGITSGCPGGNFCPSQNLTRGELAAFLARALGLHWPN